MHCGNLIKKNACVLVLGGVVHVWGKVVLEFISPTLKIVVLFFYHKDAYLDNDSSLP